MEPMHTPFVKICGLSTEETVDAAVAAGASAVGFVFAPSPRLVTANRARVLIERVPEGIETVGVFRKQPLSEVLATANAAGLTTVQFHGYEPLSDVVAAQKAGFQTLRAFAIDEYLALGTAERERWNEERLLIDAVEPGGGIPFDPAQLGDARPTGWWLLAGGLTPGNVADCMSVLQPTGVDVSSGVESTRGVKSIERIRAFAKAALRQ